MVRWFQGASKRSCIGSTRTTKELTRDQKVVQVYFSRPVFWVTTDNFEAEKQYQCLPIRTHPFADWKGTARPGDKGRPQWERHSHSSLYRLSWVLLGTVSIRKDESIRRQDRRLAFSGESHPRWQALLALILVSTVMGLTLNSPQVLGYRSKEMCGWSIDRGLSCAISRNVPAPA
ncbi:hypothetical protein JAAARDRAFT_336574 [Jaapia argillacea MUCL 33604]|uniref:Uncharacterized protein n=1 Tax=Jaapia argillacea MUCL 33604 TaxID=933084 RepID=A0A067PNQ8_9AGAM|nr:hypothetical protein JAAARDRAFT_336574 [Jaapia argillacea MUCL 33604]